MRRFWQGEWPAWSLLAGMFVAGAVAWSRLPERVPVHWALDGTIERYGGRVEGVLLLPLLSLIIYILCALCRASIRVGPTTPTSPGHTP